MGPDSRAAERPTLTVVVPTHNTRDLTLRCLATLREHSVEATEIIVVDDSSRDGTTDAIRAAYPDVQVLRNNQLRGFSFSANRGLDAASGSFLLLLNSDTEVAQQCLSGLLEVFDRWPQLGIVGARLINPDGTAQWSGGREPSFLWLFAAASGVGSLKGRLLPRRVKTGSIPHQVNWVAGTAMTMRREVWESYGPLDERFELYCQDLDFCVRTAAAGWHIAIAQECQVLHHLGATVAQFACGKQDEARLWGDLVRWFSKWNGDAAGKKAALVLGTAGMVREASLLLAVPFAGHSRRRSLHYRIAKIRDARRHLKATRPVSAD